MAAYLDTDKSIMISAPAGSGKTEKLARRYIALLQAGVEIERILAITFTDKAAAEMKQRILKILKKEDENLFHQLLQKTPLMRVSTIHSFCGTLLRRFSFEAAIDPNYSVEDAIESEMLWEEVFYDVLLDAGKGGQGHELFLETIGEKGFRGLASLKDTIGYLFKKNPFSLKAETARCAPAVMDTLIEELRSWKGAGDVIEGYENIITVTPPDLPLSKGRSSEKLITSIEKYFLTEKHEPRKKPPAGVKGITDYPEWTVKMHVLWQEQKLAECSARAERIFEIYRKCMDRYESRKKNRRVLDFSDLEYLTYRMLNEHPEWANILYAFDEKTDHILVDEFQDTNSFQWSIINKLTEEWRSGMGAKREEGTRPTLFFVGDEKQSIYFFRGANVELFQRAKEQMETWLGDEFSYEEARENYRSLPAIIGFTNHVFSKIMGTAPGRFPWITKYGPFNAQRPGVPHAGRVEIILLNDAEDENMQETKAKEADVLAQRIQGLAGNLQITDKSSRHLRFCRYMDMAILLRKRTHLKIYEEALRKYNIPFVAVKGIGFYQEAEVAVLRSLLLFLANTKDDYSLYVVLKSPLFMIEESMILSVIANEGDCLFAKIQTIGTEKGVSPPLMGGDKGEGDNLESATTPLRDAVAFLNEWLSLIPTMPLAELLEAALVGTKAWRYFHEPQIRANIKKFIRLIEGLEAEGKSLIMIRDFLERTFSRDDEPKANVNAEGMDAVRIMTIHAAKGLEFPIVFVPGIEEQFMIKSDENLVYEAGDGGFFFKSVPESSIRKQDEDFLIQQAKEEEEQRRLFYVAVTRAEEGLFLTGRWNSRDKSFLSFLRQGLGIEKKEGSLIIADELEGLIQLTEDDVKMLYEHAPKPVVPEKAPLHMGVIPLPEQRQASWRSVTETADIRRRHGKEWLLLGDVVHRIFEGLSKGTLQEKDIRSRLEKMLASKGVQRELTVESIALIEKDILTLKEKGLWQDIILPRENSFTELPFILEEGESVYSGRIDRVIKENGEYRVYDYKTFPVEDKELGYLLKEYGFQMHIYRKAVGKLFSTNAVRSFIVFTHIGDVREVYS